jgi:hypothetical protein
VSCRTDVGSENDSNDSNAENYYEHDYPDEPYSDSGLTDSADNTEDGSRLDTDVSCSY